ncbi:hypothetical protein MOC46_04715 [Bacillus spizizenii]|nr:hypothetical protein [Bacillus spizizenii]MCY8394543.1 hypothetical protein [Bacillus spizizenii]
MYKIIILSILAIFVFWLQISLEMSIVKFLVFIIFFLFMKMEKE